MSTKNITELKDNISDSLFQWIDERIDGLVETNPKLKIASVYLKRGAKNYVLRERGKIDAMIDNASLFLCDENGNLDADVLFSDLMQMFRDMDEVPFGKGFIQGTFGKGTIRFALPESPIINLLFGDTGAIKITDADILELKKIIMEQP